MSIKHLRLSKQKDLKVTELNGVNEELEKLNTRAGELEKTIDEAQSEEDLKLVDEEIAELQAQKEELEQKKVDIEAEIADIEKELEELENRSKLPSKKKGGKVDMEVREGINKYVKTKGQVREGFTSVEGGALIPEEVLKGVERDPQTLSLKKLVNVVPVNSGSGKYPVIKRSGKKMASTAELAKNPELAKPVIEEVKYDIDTYRGYIPVSQEIIDDADYDVTGLISREITDQAVNTENFEIAEVLKTASAKAVQGLDALKTLVNKEIKKAYVVKFVMSASMYDAIDKLKDKNGRYLLQDNITVESGKTLFGKEVIAVDDTVLGSAGEMKAFVGDVNAFCTLFDRKNVSVKWQDNEVYGQLLAGYVRFDVKKCDADAGYFVTYTDVPGL